MRESEAMAVLAAAREVGYVRREAALQAAGSAENVLADPAAYARALGEDGVRAVRASLERADGLLERLWRDGVHLIVRGSEGYPALLAQTARPPHLLFCVGQASLHDRAPLAVVGTRRASAYGLRHTRGIARELAAQGVSIVSGLARGIDAAAHEGALDAGGRTIAVLGSALDRMYPAENRGLMECIVAEGGSVVSEYAPGTSPTRYSFLQRNRIIAGLSLGVLVTEGPQRSGALSTAQRALDEGREVFALPGDIDRATAQLPNRLIAEGAHVVTCSGDILSQLTADPAPQGRTARSAPKPKREQKPEEKPAAKPAAPARELDAQERAVYDLLLAGDQDFDGLSERTGIASEELGSVLMMMELDGIVVSLPGCLYRLA